MAKFIHLLLLGLICCSAQANVLENESQGFPIDLQGIEGWHGARLIRYEKYGQAQCGVSFQLGFGSKKSEMDFLNYFTSHARQIQNGATCDILPMRYGVLNQLRLQAIEKQNSEAAISLLYAGASTTPFDLDGEVAETYTEDYLLPVLEKFVNLKKIVTENKMEHIANRICSEVSWRKDVGDKSALKRIKHVIARLRDVGVKNLANKINQMCSV